MTCLHILSAFFAIASISSAQHHNQADVDGLRGPVRSVLTESFDGDGDLNSRIVASELVLYDREGFRVEEFRYDLDGSVHSHTRYTRKEWQVFKVETTSVSPDENRTAVTQFNSEGLVAGTETYDGSGVLLDKTTRRSMGDRCICETTSGPLDFLR